MDEIVPVCGVQGSDSSALDNMVELYIKNGYSPQKALMLLVPEAFKDHPSLEGREEIKDFYEYHAGMQEPWDGPANITFCDGNIIGACLYRNGLRPARYELTHDGMIYFGSEVGTNKLDESKIKEKGRLGPG
jgi:glutamate synthase (ferredoxin)